MASNHPLSSNPFGDNRQDSDYSNDHAHRITLADDQISPFPSSSSVNLNGQSTPYDYPPSSFSHSNLGVYPSSNQGVCVL